MKVVEELPKSIYYTYSLRFTSSKKLIKNKEKKPVLVSLTSIPSRLSMLDVVVKSILNQSVLPEKIYLWLHHDLRTKLPKGLSKLQSDIFEIKYSDLMCSHRKLIHTLKENSNKVIITCDDDFIYRENWLENLYNEHVKFNKAIIGNVTTKIGFDNKGNYLPTSQWKYSDDIANNRLLAIGAGGVLYPPNCLDERVLNQELFLKLTPKADDLWFKAMSLLKGTVTRKATVLPDKPLPVMGSQKISLKQHNVKEGGNDKQWKAVANYFNLHKVL